MTINYTDVYIHALHMAHLEVNVNTPGKRALAEQVVENTERKMPVYTVQVANNSNVNFIKSKVIGINTI